MPSVRRWGWQFCGVLLAVSAVGPTNSHAAERPNIIFILADDLGYGDVSCLNPQGKIPTPHIDRLAAEGMTFTDAHSGSAVCTPTRYGILTGRYSWRTRLAQGVLFGYDQPLIAADRLTVGKLLQGQGYHTACIGKWHLGLKWPLKDGGFAVNDKNAWEVDYAQPIQEGPTSRGFDYFFGISASLDMPPYVYIENERSLGIPTVEKQWIRKGPATEDFEAVDVLPRLTARAEHYITERAADPEQRPFFLYMPLNSPHTPILPTAEFADRSGISAYADFVMQTDATVGRVLDALDRAGVAQNTLIFFASDNGCSPQANFAQLAEHDHDPSYEFRGHKADIFEGGHRIPFLVRWPGRVAAQSRSEQTICLNDFLATCADVLDVTLPANAGEDSVSLLPALTGQDQGPLHEAVVHHSINGSFAIRHGPWKLCFCPDSGGWSDPRPGRKEAEGLPAVQLFQLQDDLAEQTNRGDKETEIVKHLTELMQRIAAAGRSTPGAPQPNDREVRATGK